MRPFDWLFSSRPQLFGLSAPHGPSGTASPFLLRPFLPPMLPLCSSLPRSTFLTLSATMASTPASTSFDHSVRWPSVTPLIALTSPTWATHGSVLSPLLVHLYWQSLPPPPSLSSLVSPLPAPTLPAHSLHRPHLKLPAPASCTPASSCWLLPTLHLPARWMARCPGPCCWASALTPHSVALVSRLLLTPLAVKLTSCF